MLYSQRNPKPGWQQPLTAQAPGPLIHNVAKKEWPTKTTLPPEGVSSDKTRERVTQRRPERRTGRITEGNDFIMSRKPLEDFKEENDMI